MKVEEVRKKVDRIWAETKKDMEKMLKETALVVKKGETHLKDASEKSMEKLEELGLSMKREKLYYELGKALSAVPKVRWAQNKKACGIFTEIRAIGRALKKKKNKKE